MWNNLSRFKKILIILAIVISLIVIPLTIIQALTQQNLKQKASGNGLILGAYPNTGVYNMNDSVSVNISLTNENKDISGIDFVISYDPNFLRFDNFIVTNPGFTTVINPNSAKTLGRIHYAAVNTSTKSFKDTSQLDIGTVSFTSIKTTGNDGVTRLFFEAPTITAANYNSGLSITQGVWQYTIKSSSQAPVPTAIPFPSSTLILSPTQASIPTIIPTSTPIPALAPTSTPTPVNSSSDANYDVCVAACNSAASFYAASDESFDTYGCIQNCKTQYGR